MKYSITMALAGMLLLSCQQENKPKGKPSKIAFTGISESIKPGDNFFDHVNKVWYDTIKIADDQVGVGSYSFLNIPQRKLLQNILEEVSATEHAKGTVEQKVGDFFASGMDTATLNQRGYEPIQPLLDEIEGISTPKEVMGFVSEQITKGNNSIMGLRVAPDNKNSQLNILHASQSGLGLPDRDYYFKTDEPSVKIQNAYKTYLSTLFDL